MIGRLIHNMQKFRAKLNNITVEHCVVRWITAWCFISVIQTVYVKLVSFQNVNSLSFLATLSLGWNIAAVMAAFFILYVTLEWMGRKGEKVERFCLFICTFVYVAICILEYKNIYFCVGCVLLMTLSASYCFRGMGAQKLEISSVARKVISVVAGLLFVGFTGGCTAMRYLTYSAPNYDLGLFSQMFHYMKTTLTMNTTCERDALMSHLCIHISPVFYLMLPFYAIYSSPVMLEVMQAVVIALGIIPLTALCRNHKLSNFETVAVVICYAAYPVMSGGCFYDIHENAFLPVLLLGFLYFIEKDSTKGIVAFMLLLLSVKEDAAIYVAFIALYMIFGRKMRKKGTAVLAISVLYFVFTTALLKQIGDGVMSFRFNNMIYGDDGNMLGIIQTVISDPAYLITQVFDVSKLEFILQTLGPLCFLPLFSKKNAHFILFGPYIMFNLMSDYAYFHSIFFQYAFGSGTLLVYLALINVADFQPTTRNKAFPMLAVSSILFFSCLMWQKTEYFETYADSYNQTIYQSFDEALSTIPEDATVTATTFLCPALSSHNTLYELYYTKKSTEYIVLDLRTATTDYNVNTYLNNDQYETVYYKPCRIAVFRNKAQ
jgi:uncharacterized membrane protein